jgi:DNA-binding helix-hairpin-helix protein with protein kinase domain
MHKRQIAHGDLHAENLIIDHIGSVFQLHVIDFDNFNAPGVPRPPMVGQNLYLAPELRAALAKGKHAIPDLYTDRFALGVLMHEIILLRHVAAGADENEADFEKAMCSGRWLQDPAATDRPKGSSGGYPVEVLNADLGRLFRSALSLSPPKRPSPMDWESELGRAINSVYCCPYCGGPCLVDVSKVKCPLCDRAFPALIAVVNRRTSIDLSGGATPIGRKDLGGSMKVSSRHAVFRRVGGETWIESFGSNGTYRWNGSGWTRLPDRKPVIVQSGDRLRIADVEVQLN